MSVAEIQNIFPEPLRVENRAAIQPYRVRLEFTKKVLAVHAVLILTVGLFAIFFEPFLSSHLYLPIHAGAIIFLTAIRYFLKSGKFESILSIAVALANSFVACSTFAFLERQGFPAWSLAAAGILILIYLAACGHDFSFLGSIFAPLIPFGIFLIALHYTKTLPPFNPTGGFFCVLIILSYSSFNQAMIMKRRRADEVLSSVADFQRDIVNLVTYPIRIILHWTKYSFRLTHD